MRADIKKTVTRRLKILEGQIRGLQKMVQAEKYCVDIITQLSAARQALSGVEDLILENHLSTHVLEQVRSAKGARVVREMLRVYRLAKKK